MPATRMLVILQGIKEGEKAALTVLAALSNASSPFAIRFAISKNFEQAFEDVANDVNVFRKGDLLFFDEDQDIWGILALLTDETHFLMLTGAHEFAPKWDRTLYARLRKVTERNAVLTGMISAEAEKYPPQAYLPAFADNFESEGVLIERGLPIVCSAAPISTVTIHPALVFGRIAFLHRVPQKPSELSIAAYLAGYTPYALDQAILWPLDKQPQYRLQGLGNTLPGTSVARFEQLAGFRYEQKRAGIKTTWGLFSRDNTYAQKLPRSLRMSQKAKGFAMKLRDEIDLPLITTAFIDLPNPQKPIPVYVLRFGFMKNIARLPLLLYAAGGQARYLRSIFPNTASYPIQSILPRNYLLSGMSTEEHMRRSKFHLMMNGAKKHREFSHVAWANIDLITDPICPDALPDFTHLMDDRVHMAMVSGKPDTSFIVMPTTLVQKLASLAEGITLEDSEHRRGLQEDLLFRRLVDTFPELFSLHEMPKKHLLIYTAFAPQLLSQRYQAILEDISQPWRQGLHLNQ